MTKSNAQLMMDARKSLEGKWKWAIVVYLLHMQLIGGFGGRGLGWLISLVIAGPVNYGSVKFFLGMAQGKQVEIGQLLDGFKMFRRVFETSLRMCLDIVLRLLLLVIPGILRAISYSQTYYILVEDQEATPKEAMAKSIKIMEGNRWRYVCLMFRFTGWFLLSILSCGIGFLWLMPYVQVTTAKFYLEVRK